MPSLATSVRRARISDAPALVELVNRAYEIEQAFVAGARTTRAEIEEKIAGGTFLVLEREGGFGAAVYFEPRGAAAYFGMLSVAPELQHMGLGRRLVWLAEALASAQGATEMTIQVVSLREELSRWYRSLGYREVGVTPFESEALKRPCHFVEMSKPLSGALARA